MLLVFSYFEHGVDPADSLVVVRARGDDVLLGVEAGRVAADHQQRGGQGAPHHHLGVLAERVLDSAANRLIVEVVQSQGRPLLGPSPG